MPVAERTQDIEGLKALKLSQSLVDKLIDFSSEINSINDIVTYVPKIGELFDDSVKAYKLLGEYLPQIFEKRGDLSAKAIGFSPFGIRRFYERLAEARVRREMYNVPHNPMILLTALDYELNPGAEEERQSILPRFYRDQAKTEIEPDLDIPERYS